MQAASHYNLNLSSLTWSLCLNKLTHGEARCRISPYTCPLGLAYISTALHGVP